MRYRKWYNPFTWWMLSKKDMNLMRDWQNEIKIRDNYIIAPHETPQVEIDKALNKINSMPTHEIEEIVPCGTYNAESDELNAIGEKFKKDQALRDKSTINDLMYLKPNDPDYTFVSRDLL